MPVASAMGTALAEQHNVDRSTPQSMDEKKERGVQAGAGYITGIVLPVTGSADAI